MSSPGRYTVNNVTITPEMARQMLDTSTGNRVPRQADLRLYRRLMESGRWVNTGEPIIIGHATQQRPKGRLLDGHTRLTACVLSGLPFLTDITYNVDEEAFAVMNCDSRTLQHHLQINNVSEVIYWPGIYRGLLQYVRKADYRTLPHKMILQNKVVEYVNTFPYASTEIAVKMRKVMSPRIAQIAATLLDMHGCNLQVRTGFFDQLESGSNLESGNPILALRNHITRADTHRLLNMFHNVSRGVALVIHGFNHWAAGNKIQSIRIPSYNRFIFPNIPSGLLREDAISYEAVSRCFFYDDLGNPQMELKA